MDSQRPKRFKHLDLPNRLYAAVRQARFSRPTQLQAQVIPPAISGNDIICQARSGMGKSLCLAMPALHIISTGANNKALLVTASQDSADQIVRVSQRLARPMRIQLRSVTSDKPPRKPPVEPLVIAPLDAAEPLVRQFDRWAAQIAILVIDQLDLMVQSGQDQQLKQLVSKVRSNRQTIISAIHLSDELIGQARQYCNQENPKIIKLETPESRWPEGHVQHEHITVTPKTRISTLARLLEDRKDQLTYIATASEPTAVGLTEQLEQAQIYAYLLSYTSQADRKQEILDRLCKYGKGPVIACDAALRGLTLPHIPQLINWDLPKYLEDYWRRVDRLAGQGPLQSLIMVDRGHHVQIQVLQQTLDKPIPLVEIPLQ